MLQLLIGLPRQLNGCYVWTTQPGNHIGQRTKSLFLQFSYKRTGMAVKVGYGTDTNFIDLVSRIWIAVIIVIFYSEPFPHY